MKAPEARFLQLERALLAEETIYKCTSCKAIPELVPPSLKFLLPPSQGQHPPCSFTAAFHGKQPLQLEQELSYISEVGLQGITLESHQLIYFPVVFFVLFF